MARYNKGQISTLDNPFGSPALTWIRDHLSYTGDACLIWPFARSRSGYPSVICRADGNLYPTRLVCERVNGPPPSPRHQAAHSCNNGHNGCIHPGHLRWKTPGENHKEAVPHPRYKLDEQKVAEIRGLKGIELVQVTAGRCGVTEATIRKIQAGKLWPTGKRSVGGFAKKPYRGGSRPKQPALTSGQ